VLRLRTALLLAAALVAFSADQASALKGKGTVLVEGGTVESILSANSKLNCDGVTDDRATFKTLVEVGGEWAGKTVDFSRCSMLWSACTSGTGDCTVATVAPGTRLLGKPGSLPTITLARRVCVGGNTPGASCAVNGASDCNGGSCVYDCPSGGTCGVTDKVFAHTAAATYTLLAAPANASCSSSGTPWPCCTGSAIGFCDMVDQNIEIADFTVAANQVEDYGRCTNGSTENGWACRGYCSTASVIPNFSCSHDGDCPSGTCLQKSLCPSASSGLIDCDAASQAPAGTGAVNVIDASGSAGVRINGLILLDHLKGKGVLVGQRAVVRNSNLVGVPGFTWSAPSNALGGGFYPAAVGYGVTVGIQAGANSDIENNRVRASSVGIDVTGTTSSSQIGATQMVTTTPTKITGNSITGTGDGMIGLRSAAPDAWVAKNQVYIGAGDFVYGIIATGARSLVEGNNVDLNTATDTDGVGIELRAINGRSVANVADVAHTTRATGIRIGSISCGSIPCVDGYYASSTADDATVGANGVAFEAFGDHATIDGAYAGPGSGGQCYAVGQNSQQKLSNVECYSGAVGVGPSNRKYCVGGGDNGKICKQNTTAAAACSGGTCTYDGFGSNYTINNSRIAFQSQMGIYLTTGTIDSANYVAWQTGAVRMLGDDRVNVGLTSTHFAITGGVSHVNASGTEHLVYAPVANGLCTAADTPWDCCTNNTTGTCAGTITHGTVTGVDFLGASTNAVVVDFSTNWSSNSPTISDIAFAGNTCQGNGSGSICFSFPASNQSKITDLTISGTRSEALTTYSNWAWSMGRIAEFVTRFFGTGITLPLSTTANYFPLQFRATCSTNESAHTIIPPPGSVLSLKCQQTAASGSAKTRSFFVRKSGADNFTCGISGTSATTCSDVATAPVAYNGSDTLNIRTVCAGASTTAADGSCTVEYGIDPY